ncbi:MAG: T9SS type A sorting domain-containing protein [Candidatus Cloacimonadaceae bacterium]
MKTWLMLTLLIFSTTLIALMPSAWSEFQKDIGIQAAQFRNSPEHQKYRQQKETRSYVVGDSQTFWRWNLSVMPPLWIQTPATCRAVGEHSYIFVADSEWNVHMTQANVDTIMVRLELNTPNNPDQGAIMMDVNLFGPIPDELDNDPKLIVFYSALGSFQGTSFDGYFSPYNQVTEAQAQLMNPPGHSNECEMIYMTCYPLNPVAPIRLSVLAHELQHLIHWGQDPNEETWLNEGCSELAMVAYGIPDPITGFPSNPDNSLTAWNQQTADYVKVMLFFTYLYEHYDQTGLIQDLVADPLNGMASLIAQLATHYPELTLGQLLSNWSAANVIDAPQPFDGLYNYTELDLPTFSMTNMNTYPTQPNQPVSAYASDYLKYTLPEGTAEFHIVCNYSHHVKMLIFNDMNVCTDVIDNGVGSFDSTVPPGTHHAVFVVTNISSMTGGYYYSIASTGTDDNSVIPVPTAITNCHPNPFSASSEISFSLEKQGFTTIKIYNTKGQLVKSMIQEFKNAGLHKVIWSGDNDYGKTLSSGIYIIRLTSNGITKTEKILYHKNSQ